MCTIYRNRSEYIRLSYATQTRDIIIFLAFFSSNSHEFQQNITQIRKSMNKHRYTQKKTVFYLCRMKKKLNYNFTSFKTHLLVYWIWWRGNEFSLWEWEKSFVANEQYAMSRKKKKKKKVYTDWKYAELINFPFISSASWMWYVSIWCGLIWFGLVCLICAIQSFARNEIDQLNQTFSCAWHELHENAAHNLGFDRLKMSTKC